MLKRCRGHFAFEAEQYRAVEKIAPTLEAKKAAADTVAQHEKFVSDIDATLRDWG
jgi:hypothetical protein